MSPQKEAKIRSLLKEEVAKRSLGASISFSLLAILIYFYHFKTVLVTPYIRAASALMLMSALLRFTSCRSYIRKPDQLTWRKIQISIWGNSLAWGAIFFFTAFELKNNGLHFIVLTSLLCGALSGSLVTLSNSRSLYLPFLAACMIPVMTVAAIQWLSWGQESGMYLLLCYSVFSMYQFLQFKTIRHLQFERLGNQVNLENSIEELRLSQEAFVKQTTKLFHASKISALGEMAGGLSHEVNNSLMTIMGSVQQLERYLERDGILKPEYEKKIHNSQEAIHQIKTVIDGLRFFSQQGEDVEKIDRPLEEIIHRTLNFCHEMIKANDIRMIVSPVPPVLVHCHPMQISQVLFSLIKNAFDALEAVKDPAKRWIKISFVEKDEEVEIRVMNGGPQISRDARSKLFQPFFTTKEVGKGTGLSLSISKGIALAHKGDIYLDEDNECTTFALKIPAVPPASTAHA